ncbi:DUF4397 domain-containing protein [Flagellimonas sp. CMM7]|uniref:DUF4397 domain-containing protein n=1 Tax=Flagellimonas sp. CMM7 TaxID=2654676 RepID=UPI0013D24569|nr:DUF4397 domain-containing protein [Flagellimonas sp. CMM7]UII80284.1 DUF4397 domain-containing protein [Flagellimonas sp. CMM7]
MRKLNIIIVLLLFSAITLSCSEEDNIIPSAASLKVFHGAVDGPPLHVNYFERPITLASNPTLRYRLSQVYTIPAEKEREISFINSVDTLSTLFSTTISIPEGGLGTLFLTGENEDIDGFYLEDRILTLQDSLVGVRFINLSPDIGEISVRVSGETNDLASGLSFKDGTEFMPLPATRDISLYTFQFVDETETVVASTNLVPVPPVGIMPLFKNITFALVGLKDNGVSGSSLLVRPINSY